MITRAIKVTIIKATICSVYVYIYIYIYINFVCHVQMFLSNVLRFLPKLQRLNKITKSVKSINFKTN